MACTHTTTARSARNPGAWVCLRCGATVDAPEQTWIEGMWDPKKGHVQTTGTQPLPSPPERKRE